MSDGGGPHASDARPSTPARVTRAGPTPGREGPPAQSLIPVFEVSCVSGRNIDLLEGFLNMLPMRREWDDARHEATQFHVDQVFDVDGVGPVVGGTLFRGTLSLGDTMLLGPDARRVPARRRPRDPQSPGPRAGVLRRAERHPRHLGQDGRGRGARAGRRARGGRWRLRRRRGVEPGRAGGRRAGEEAPAAADFFRVGRARRDVHAPVKRRSRIGWSVDDDDFLLEEGCVAYPALPGGRAWDPRGAGATTSRRALRR